jgi:formylglycine-generating enzyme required for sulfatase activity
MTDRERLGLPDYYFADRFGPRLPEAYERLRGVDRNSLATLCEDAGAPLIDRLAGGNLLALLGDPRIDTRNPVMIAIAGRSVEIGLSTADLDVVLARYPKLGLDRKWLEKECPRHAVNLDPYAISKYPVTNQEYREFLLDTGYVELPSSWIFRRYPQEFSNHPVYTVSPDAADAYAGWLTKITGRPFRLPTEAEWEYAAAGPAGFEFPWGQEFDADRSNTAETGLFHSSAVGVFADGNSPFGVADMAGNVEEYVSDAYAPYPGGSFIMDHLVEIHGGYRVARGGSFARFRDLARTRRRHGHNPRSAAYVMGFRLAEDLS